MPPLAIAAGVAAVGSIAGGAISASAAKKAGNTAAAATTANNTLQTQIYDSNKSVLAPYTMRGNAAGDQINSLLGLGGGRTDWGGYVNGNSDALAQWNTDASERARFGGDINAFGQFHYTNDGARRDLAPYTSNGNASALAGYNTFANSAGYQARQDAANKAINVGYAARGGLESGAAQKALQKNASVLAGDYFGQYLGALQGQQQTGLSSASALAGVGQTYAGAVSANNTAGASVQGQAALVGAGQMGSVLSGLGNTALSIYGSSYGSGGSSVLANKPGTIQINPAAFPRWDVLTAR